MYDSDDKDLNEREEMMGSKTQPMMRSYISRIQQGSDLEKQKRNRAFKSVVNMDKESGRNPSDFLKGHPPAACDARFDGIKGNIELCSKFKNSK